MGATPAICHDQNLGFVPTADILVPLICHKSQEEASAFALSDLQQILVGWKKKQQVLTAMVACMSASLLIALWHYIAYIYGFTIITASVAFHQPEALHISVLLSIVSS